MRVKVGVGNWNEYHVRFNGEIIFTSVEADDVEGWVKIYTKDFKGKEIQYGYVSIHHYQALPYPVEETLREWKLKK